MKTLGRKGSVGSVIFYKRAKRSGVSNSEVVQEGKCRLREFAVSDWQDPETSTVIASADVHVRAQKETQD